MAQKPSTDEALKTKCGVVQWHAMRTDQHHLPEHHQLPVLNPGNHPSGHGILENSYNRDVVFQDTFGTLLCIAWL